MKSICAIIISYNGNERISELVDALQDVADTVLIVDNGSRPEILTRLDDLDRKYEKVNVQYLSANTGIAFALNVGLKYAVDNCFKWVITFDQDTVPQKGAVKRLHIFAEKYLAESDKNVSFGSQLAISDDQKLIEKKARRGNRNVSYLITSGNLTLTEAAQKAGGWTDELFIDSVDYDFSIKLRSAGYRLWRCYDCVMMHQVGETNEKGVKNTHNNLRKYYIIRNHKYILQKYFFKYPFYCCFSTLFFLKGILRWFMTEDDKKEMFKIIKKALSANVIQDYENYLNNTKKNLPQ